MFKKIYNEVMSNLESNLPSWLHYHSPAHTRYVLERAEALAEKEGISGRDLFLIKVAALYHDLGFVQERENHEQIACNMAAKELPQFGLTQEEITKVCKMIKATQIPQKPTSTLEKILADADLEYLGTDDYYETSENLYREILHYQPNLSRAEWNKIQIDFLSQHSYHTDFCRQHREPKKTQHLNRLRENPDPH